MIEKVEGLADLDRALGEMPKATARNVLKRTATTALHIFIDVVKGIAPVDDASDTPDRPAGSYRDSWIVGTKLNKGQARNVRREGKNFVEVYAGSTQSSLGVALEEGTIERINKDTGGSYGSVPPQPHARPAWNVTKGEVLKSVKVQLSSEIARAAKRLAKRSKG